MKKSRAEGNPYAVTKGWTFLSEPRRLPSTMKNLVILLVLSMTSAASGQIQFRADIEETEVATQQANYAETLKELSDSRAKLLSAYRAASTANEKAQVIDTARTTITDTLLNRIFPAWYGTQWDFNGVSQTPGQGQIACGYFVTTCLRDAGFNLQRVKLAQQASQRIIKTMAEKNAIQLYYDKPIEVLEAHLKKSGTGIYIVGLDTHTGFVVNDGKNLAFIHSSYYRPPFSVTAEPITGSNPLADSKYRMIGKILSDEMIRKWLTGDAFPMK